jgi:hypothetical protein
LVSKVHLVTKVLAVPLDHKVLWVPLERKVTKVSKVPKVMLVILVCLVYLVHQERLVTQEWLVHLVPPDHGVILVHEVQSVLQVTTVKMVFPV